MSSKFKPGQKDLADGSKSNLAHIQARTRSAIPVKPPQARTKAKQGVTSSKQKRLYVLDTNVLMHDPSCLFRFQEHDLYITTTVREELDKHKTGNEEHNRNAREVSRTIKSILLAHQGSLVRGIPLFAASKKIATGSLFFQTDELPHVANIAKADHRIIATVHDLAKRHKDTYEVVLVTKDTNMFIEAWAQGITVEDYHNDMVIQDTDLLYPGSQKLPPYFWEKVPNFTSWKEGHHVYYRTSQTLTRSLLSNEFIFNEQDPSMKENLRVVRREDEGNSVVLQVITDHSIEKNAVRGITSLNREQNFALNLLMDANVDLVTLVGAAGSGKTLLALASALAQSVDSKRYHEIVVSRAPVPVGDDIGFLPGTEKEKIDPWMGALYDNLEVLAERVPSSLKTKMEKGAQLSALRQERENEHAEVVEKLRGVIQVKSLSFMRGRTFLKKFVIIDEVQNLTAKQVKMLVTRAGPGTKMVFLGNLAQIDTPFLTEGSSGLAYLVDRFKGWNHGGHLILPKGERSRLATHAEEVL